MLRLSIGAAVFAFSLLSAAVVTPAQVMTVMVGDRMKMHDGMASLKTEAGGTVTIVHHGKGLALKDEKGGIAEISIADVFQSNGVIHVISSVAMSK